MVEEVSAELTGPDKGGTTVGNNCLTTSRKSDFQDFSAWILVTDVRVTYLQSSQSEKERPRRPYRASSRMASLS
jgi:hypothetical protein